MLVRKPRAKATAAGATPNEIFPEVSLCHEAPVITVAYQVSQRIQFLPHQRRLLSPSCDLAVEEIKEKAQWHEPQCQPQVCQIFGVRKAIAHRREDGHDYGTMVSRGKARGPAAVAHPQNPGFQLVHFISSNPSGMYSPFNSVIKSARCRALLRSVSHPCHRESFSLHQAEMTCVLGQQRGLF